MTLRVGGDIACRANGACGSGDPNTSFAQRQPKLKKTDLNNANISHGLKTEAFG